MLSTRRTTLKSHSFVSKGATLKRLRIWWVQLQMEWAKEKIRIAEEEYQKQIRFADGTLSRSSDLGHSALAEISVASKQCQIYRDKLAELRAS